MPLPHVACLAGLVMLTTALQAKAADKSSTGADPLKVFKGKRLNADRPTDRDQRDYYRMVRGSDEEYPLPADRRKDLLVRVPRWLIYRLTWEEIHEGQDQYTIADIMKGTPEGLMDGILEAFPPANFRSPTEDPVLTEKRKRQQKYLDEFRPIAAEYLKEVLNNRLLVARLNAAIVLHRFAQYDEEEVAEDLLTILENPAEHDAVKLWALKGMGELFTQSIDQSAKNPERLERCALAVYAWLEKRIQIPASQVAELSEPEQDGIRYIRRQAIRTLGSYRRPMIIDDGLRKSQEGPAASLLLQIMNNQGVTPEASWSEREAAAVALCHLQCKRSPAYQPAFVVQQIGRFVANLGVEASNDRSRSSQRWQFYAADLKAATDTLAEDLGKATPAAAYLSRLMVRVNPVLDNLYDETRHPSAVADLNQAVNTMPSVGQGVFTTAAAKP